MATAPEASSTTVKLQWLNNDKLTTFGGCEWQKNQKGLVGNTIEMVAWSNSGRIDSGSDGFRLQLFVPHTVAFRSTFGDGDGKEVVADSRDLVC